MRPNPRSSMPGTTAPVTWSVVHRCWSSMPLSSSGSRSATGVPPAQPPTRWTSTSTPPSRASAASTTAWAEARSVSSPVTGAHASSARPASPATSRSRASSRPTSASRAPPVANRFTTARPRLPVAPVTRTRGAPSARIGQGLQPLVLLLLEPGVAHQMTALAHLRLEVGTVVRVRLHHERDATHDVHAEVPQPVELARVVRHESHAPHAERVEHVGRDGVVALVVAEPEREVRLDGVEPVVLERVRPDLVRQPDAA